MSEAEPPRREPVTTSVKDGILRATGLALPGAAIGLVGLYHDTDLTRAEHIMLWGIIALFLFCIVGYSTLHPRLWRRYGRLSSFLGFTFALVIAATRTLAFFGLITVDQNRLINTAAAVVLAGTLAYTIWWHPLLRKAITYLMAQEDKQP